MFLSPHGDIPPVPYVFAYGSLIWRPGFTHLGSEPALLRGAHRSLCVYSHHYRGTPERPGLVFGLKQGGACHGMAFAIDPHVWSEVRAYLWERELVSGVYRPALRSVRLASGRAVPALTFIANPHHVQYAGILSIDDQIRLVRQGVGTMGPNVDYVLQTASHLVEMGITDRTLSQLSRALQAQHHPPA